MKPVLNQNNSLLTILNINNGGYRLYETNLYKKVSEEDDYQSLFGELRFFVPLYESQICFFVGASTNINFSPNQVVIWDESRKRKIGIIVLKSDCDDLKVRKEFILCLSDNKVLIYDIFTMNLMCVFEDCCSKLPVSLNSLNFPAVLGYQSKLNMSQIKICKIDFCKFDDKEISNFIKNRYPFSFSTNFSNIYKIKGKAQYVVTTLFKSINNYQINSKGEILLIIGEKNKIHIYSLIDFQLLLCFNLELTDVLVENISFSPVNLFISIGYITGDIHIYSLIKELDEYFTQLKKAQNNYNCMLKTNNKIKLKNSSSDNIAFKIKSNYKANCNCLEEFENNLKKDKSSSVSLFNKIVNIKNYFFEDFKKTSFANITATTIGKHYICLFYKRNEIQVISDSNVFKYKFSSTEGGRGWCIESLTYNKNFINTNKTYSNISSNNINNSDNITSI